MNVAGRTCRYRPNSRGPSGAQEVLVLLQELCLRMAAPLNTLDTGQELIELNGLLQEYIIATNQVDKALGDFAVARDPGPAGSAFR